MYTASTGCYVHVPLALTAYKYMRLIRDMHWIIYIHAYYYDYYSKLTSLLLVCVQLLKLAEQ